MQNNADLTNDYYGPVIILVRPQMGENIGSVARAMSNFGFKNLRLVNPKNGWPDEKAMALACNAREVINNVIIYDSLAKALDGCDFIYATSSRFRAKVNKEILTPDQLVNQIKKENQFKHKVAFIFGAENNGLTNDEIVLSQKIVSITTSEDYKVLNLAQAACIICYELYKNCFNDFSVKQHKHEKANAESIDIMTEMLDQKLKNTNYYKDDIRRESMYLGLKNIFMKANLSNAEVKSLNGIFKYLYFYKQ